MRRCDALTSRTRDPRGVRQEAEAPAERWGREKQGDAKTSRTDKRHKRRCRNERHWQMGDGGVRRGNTTTSRTRGLGGVW
jgi:hypothetical protein